MRKRPFRWTRPFRRRQLTYGSSLSSIQRHCITRWSIRCHRMSTVRIRIHLAIHPRRLYRALHQRILTVAISRWADCFRNLTCTLHRLPLIRSTPGHLRTLTATIIHQFQSPRTLMTTEGTVAPNTSTCRLTTDWLHRARENRPAFAFLPIRAWRAATASAEYRRVALNICPNMEVPYPISTLKCLVLDVRVLLEALAADPVSTNILGTLVPVPLPNLSQLLTN